MDIWSACTFVIWSTCEASLTWYLLTRKRSRYPFLKKMDLLKKQVTCASGLKQLSAIRKIVSQLNLHIKQCASETALSRVGVFWVVE